MNYYHFFKWAKTLTGIQIMTDSLYTVGRESRAFFVNFNTLANGYGTRLVVRVGQHQRLRRLRKFGTSPSILRSFYTCTVESILTGCITAWFGNSTAGNRKALKRVMRTARHIVGGELPSLQDFYTRRFMRKARRIIKDSSHPSHKLLSLLPSGRRLRSIRSHTSQLRDNFFLQAIRLMNRKN